MEAKIRLTREKLIAAVGVMADELIGQINSECDALLAQVRPKFWAPPPSHVIVVDEELEEGEIEDDDEEQPSDSFIDDAPQSVDENSSSSSSESDQVSEKAPTKAKLPPPVHYKMNPTNAGKRERKAPVRFSPPSKGSKRGRAEDEDSDSVGEDLTRKRGKANKNDQEHWNMVRKMGKVKRVRNPWWRTKVLDPLRIVRAGLGMESAKNTGPRQLWDDIEADPDNVELHHLSHATRTKCAFCGTTKYCNRTLEMGGSSHLLGSSCARVAEAWRDFCQTLPESEDFADVEAALQRILDAHAGKRHKDDDDDDE